MPALPEELAQVAAYPALHSPDLAVLVTDAKVVPPTAHLVLPSRHPFRQGLCAASVPAVPYRGLEPFQARGRGLRVAFGVYLEP
jgi:hypothetical protein